MTQLSSANFQKMLSPSYIILRIQSLEGSVDLNEVATSSRSMLFGNSAIFVSFRCVPPRLVISTWIMSMIPW